MIGSTNLSGGGGVGSDELTATAANVLEETTYVGADTDDELAEGTMQHLTNRATITHTTENATKVIEGDAAFTSTNSDGTARAEIRYNGTEGFITPNTLFAVPQGDMATAGGLAAEKLLEGQSAFGIAGKATSDATATAAQMTSGATAYVKGSKITGTLAERGQAQFGGFGQGNGYVAINALPEGIYRSNGAAWAPEARIATSTLASGIGLNSSVIKKGVTILGITGSFEGPAGSPSYIFNNGSYGSILPNGFTGVNSDSPYISSKKLYLPTRKLCFFSSTSAIKFSGYKYLKVYIYEEHVYGTGHLYLTFHNSFPQSSNINVANLELVTSKSAWAWLNFDISSINGTYYLGMKAYALRSNSMEYMDTTQILQMYLSTN